MASGNASANQNFIWGWVSGSDTRGTLDIVWSCVCTIFLCSWSCLCLNIPTSITGHFGYLKYKLHWQLFTILFPEVTVAIAAEQWESANQSVETFSQLGHGARWSRRHAFLADMGGIRIKAPDLDEPLAVTSYQLAWLVERQHLPMPDITLAMVDDKDRNDGFARAATLVQIVWFSVQCVGRWIQDIGLTTLELTTVAFILCTLHTFFFWFDKPQDVEAPIDFQTTSLISEILARQQPNDQISSPRAWLGAVQPPPDPRSLTTPFWFGVGAVFNTNTRSSPGSTWRFENSQTTPPKGITTPQMLYGILFELAYFGMHLVGWILVFPTTAERVLWATASLTLLGLLLLYLLAWAIGQRVAPAAARFFFHKDATTIIEVARLFPRWAQIAIHAPVVVIYVLARGYILVESFVSLRALPKDLYQSVQWSDYMPHI